MDPYAYVGNNPEGRTDPTGHCWPLCTMIIGAVIGAAVSVAATVVTSAIQGKAPTGGELLQAAAVGAVTGAISGLVGPEAGPLAHVAVGALANGAGQMVGNLMAGKPLMSGVGEAVITGAITGGLVEGAGALLKGVGSKVLSSVEEDTASHLNLEGTTCSFTPQTVVATQHGKQAIGKVQVGERVLAYNPKTGKMELEPILHVWIHTDNDLIDLTLTTTIQGSHGKVRRTSDLIHTNQKHPFFTIEDGFLPVGQIKLGMHVLRADGRFGVVTGWKVVPGTKTMYNLEVAQDHTFTVGAGQWVVHNCALKVPVHNDIVPYDTKFPIRSGFQKHHGVLDVWAQANIAKYASGDAPSVVLTDAEHNLTRAYFANWRIARTGSLTGYIDWSTLPPGEVQDLAYGMFNAARVPSDVVVDYFRAFHQYIYLLP